MPSPEVINMEITLRKVASIDTFRGSTGKRIMNMPYYRMIDGALVFSFIHQDTDVKELIQYIQQGIIYTPAKDDDELPSAGQ